MSNKYFDIHGHMNFAAYDEDREEVIGRANKMGISMITIGTDLNSSKSAIKFAEQYSNMWASIGMHPIFAGESHNDPQETGINEKSKRPKQDYDAKEFEEMAKHSKVVAIGECGLDYFHSGKEDIEVQKEMFQKHIDLANKINKPLMLHIRNSKESGFLSAYQEAFVILRNSAKVKGNLHFFAGSIDEAKPFLDLGYTFSFTGAITYGSNYEEIIKYLPLDRIMSETDCPYVAPIPYRGKRNEPSYVIEVVKKIAQIRGEDEEMVAETLFRNAEEYRRGILLKTHYE